MGLLQVNFILQLPSIKQHLTSNTWCSITENPYCIKFKDNQYIVLRDGKQEGKAQVQVSDKNHKTITFSIVGQKGIENQYLLISEDTIHYKRIDFGIEGKSTYVLVREK